MSVCINGTLSPVIKGLQKMLSRVEWSHLNVAYNTISRSVVQLPLTLHNTQSEFRLLEGKLG